MRLLHRKAKAPLLGPGYKVSEYGQYGMWSDVGPDSTTPMAFNHTVPSAQDRLRLIADRLAQATGPYGDFDEDDDTLSPQQLRMVADLLDVPDWGIV